MIYKICYSMTGTVEIVADTEEEAEEYFDVMSKRTLVQNIESVKANYIENETENQITFL